MAAGSGADDGTTAASGEGAARAILHAAMAVYLARYLNVPPARLPGEAGGPPLDDLPTDAEALGAALLDAFDRQRQVDAAARLVARYLTLEHRRLPSSRRSGGPCCARTRASTPTRCSRPACGSSLSGAATRPRAGTSSSPSRAYLAAHAPTERSAQQTVEIARRLMRGAALHADAQ